jgi:hypothetical protein
MRRMSPPTNYRTGELASVDLAELRRLCLETRHSSGTIKAAIGPVSALQFTFGSNTIEFGPIWPAGAQHPYRFRQIVRLVASGQPFGGARLWFLCGSCGRRCRVLYLVRRFACRQCCGVRYDSQYEAPAERVLRRRWKLHRRFGAPPHPIDMATWPKRPSGMRWSTYLRLVGEDKELCALWHSAMASPRRKGRR